MSDRKRQGSKQENSWPYSFVRVSNTVRRCEPCTADAYINHSDGSTENNSDMTKRTEPNQFSAQYSRRPAELLHVDSMLPSNDVTFTLKDLPHPSQLRLSKRPCKELCSVLHQRNNPMESHRSQLHRKSSLYRMPNRCTANVMPIGEVVQYAGERSSYQFQTVQDNCSPIWTNTETGVRKADNVSSVFRDSPCPSLPSSYRSTKFNNSSRLTQNPLVLQCSHLTQQSFRDYDQRNDDINRFDLNQPNFLRSSASSISMTSLIATVRRKIVETVEDSELAVVSTVNREQVHCNQSSTVRQSTKQDVHVTYQPVDPRQLQMNIGNMNGDFYDRRCALSSMTCSQSVDLNMSAGRRLNVLHQEQICHSGRPRLPQCFDNVLSTLDSSVSLSSENLSERNVQVLFKEKVPTKNNYFQQFSVGNQVSDFGKSRFSSEADFSVFSKFFEE